MASAPRLRAWHTPKGETRVAGRPSGEYALEQAKRIEKFLGEVGSAASLFHAKKNLVLSDGADRGKVDIDANMLTVGGIFFPNVNLTADLNVAGVNGRDAGSEAASTWYAVHVILARDGESVQSLLSLSSTAPTLPAGYVDFRHVGWVLNNSDSDLYRFYHIGDWWWWSENTSAAPFRVKGAGADTSWTDVACSGAIPSGCTLGLFALHASITAVGASRISIRPNGSAWVNSNVNSVYTYNNTNGEYGIATGEKTVPLDTSRVIEYEVAANTTGNIEVQGYYLEL